MPRAKSTRYARPTEDEGPMMDWCDEGGLARLWRECGLEDVRFDAIVAAGDYDGFEDLWAPFTAGIGPAGAFCVSLDEDERAALHDAYRRRLGVGDEPFRITARAWAAAGTVPG